MLKKKTRTPIDILTLKTQQLESVTKEAANAVSLVSVALEQMKSASQKMKTHMEDIDAYCSSLQAVRGQLDQNYIHNEAVIANFSKLLCIESDEVS